VCLAPGVRPTGRSRPPSSDVRRFLSDGLTLLVAGSRITRKLHVPVGRALILGVGQAVGDFGVEGLAQLMSRTSGAPEVVIGLIDGPVDWQHQGLIRDNLREIAPHTTVCADSGNPACVHGTFLAGVFAGAPGSVAPGLCPGCTLLLRPLFHESGPLHFGQPGASAEELAQAIIDVVAAGAQIVNLSVSLMRGTDGPWAQLDSALDYAAKRGAVAVLAAGNQGAVGGTRARHPVALPVAACDSDGRPLPSSNLGGSLARRGVSAPGERITSLGACGGVLTFGGTSVATALVSGLIALLCSLFPWAGSRRAADAVIRTARGGRKSIIPPIVNASAAYDLMATNSNPGRRR
jgi:subtilisin family serine protease